MIVAVEQPAAHPASAYFGAHVCSRRARPQRSRSLHADVADRFHAVAQPNIAIRVKQQIVNADIATRGRHARRIAQVSADQAQLPSRAQNGIALLLESNQSLDDRVNLLTVAAP